MPLDTPRKYTVLQVADNDDGVRLPTVFASTHLDIMSNHNDVEVVSSGKQIWTHDVEDDCVPNNSSVGEGAVNVVQNLSRACGGPILGSLGHRCGHESLDSST